MFPIILRSDSMLPKSFPQPRLPKSFPCSQPGCHRSFSHPSGRTRHYNAHHRPLSPDSEPDPALEFSTQYHPKLNGLSEIPRSLSNVSLFQQHCHVTGVATLSPHMLGRHLLLLLMQLRTTCGTHSRTAWRSIGRITTLLSFSHPSLKSTEDWTCGWQPL